jgi:hypothetical protein
LSSRLPLFAAAAVLVVSAGCGRGPFQVWPLQSPGGRLTVFVEQAADSRALSFRIIESRTGRSIVRSSPLELTTDSVRFADSLAFISQSPVREIAESVLLRTGVRYGLNAFQTTITFENPSGSRICLDWLAADDGVAFRHRPPDDGANATAPPAWRVMTPAGEATDSTSGAGFAEALRLL